MYAKLAWRNIRRSLRDYGIYFLTLLFAVAIFYVFNSLTDQPAFATLRTSTRRMAEGAVTTLEWLTIIMTGVVTLLVLYANRAIIRKRSRELGTYMLLGMEQGRLALLLLAEVVMIGMAALLMGLVAGIFLSQFFALVVAKLFDVELAGRPFVFSAGAAVKTLVTYGVVFLLVGLWQASALYRQKLIDLITGARKNEAVRLRNRLLSLAVGLLSLLTLGAAYWLSDQVSRDPFVSFKDKRIPIGAALGVVGTYLLFVGAAGLLTGVRGKQNGWMGRGLNRFLYRQVTSKVNTHVGMLATITLMLTFTICAMSFGLGLGRGMADRADREVPFDYLFITSSANPDFAPVLRLFDQYGMTERQVVPFRTAASGMRGRDLMHPADMAWFEEDGGIGEFVLDVNPQVMAASAYQALRALKGYPPVELPAEGYLIHYAAEQTEHARQARQAFGRFLASGGTVELAGHTLQPSAAQVFTEPLGEQLSGHAALLVVPDAVADGLPTDLSLMAIELAGRAPEEMDQVVWSVWDPGEGFAYVQVRAHQVEMIFVIEGMLLFISLYIGIMFILISATLLALQQVTDAVEHKQRFDILRKLGADDRMIDGAIARQLGLYFLIPVAVALLHSLFAVMALARLFALGAGYTTVWSASLVTLGIFLLIYGAYYLLSLQSCRSLFQEARS